MANISAFQANDASSILAARTKVKASPSRLVFTLVLGGGGIESRISERSEPDVSS